MWGFASRFGIAPASWDSRYILIPVLLVVAAQASCAREDQGSALGPPLGDPIVGVDLSPDGSRVAAVSNPVADASQQGTLAVWDVATGREIGRRRIEAGLTSVLFLSHDRIAVGAVGGSVEIADAASLKTRLHHASRRGTPTCLAKSADSRTLFVGRLNDGIERLSTESLEEIGEAWPLAESMVTVAIRALDKERILVVGWDGTWTVWRISADKASQVILNGKLAGVVRGAAVSSDGAIFVTAGPGRAAKLVEVESGKVLGEVIDPADDILAADFGGTREQVLTGSRGGCVRLWDWPGKRVMREWRVAGAVGALAVDRERGIWVVGDETGRVHRERFAAGQPPYQAKPGPARP